MERYFGRGRELFFPEEHIVSQKNTLKDGSSHTVVGRFVIRSNLSKAAFINR